MAVYRVEAEVTYREVYRVEAESAEAARRAIIGERPIVAEAVDGGEITSVSVEA